jgi:hypothetical protein
MQSGFFRRLGQASLFSESSEQPRVASNHAMERTADCGTLHFRDDLTTPLLSTRAPHPPSLILFSLDDSSRRQPGELCSFSQLQRTAERTAVNWDMARTSAHLLQRVRKGEGSFKANGRDYRAPRSYLHCYPSRGPRGSNRSLASERTMARLRVYYPHKGTADCRAAP